MPDNPSELPQTHYMSPNERQLYASLIYPSTKLLEFGSGSSTRWLLRMPQLKLISVGSDRNLVNSFGRECEV